MDRNIGISRVALRKESVDRNNLHLRRPPFPPVALRKESVDRNAFKRRLQDGGKMSLSARRAWIEMMWSSRLCACFAGRSPQGERG